MPGLVPPASHCDVVVLKPLAEATTLTCAGVIRFIIGRAAVIACSPLLAFDPAHCQAGTELSIKQHLVRFHADG